MTVTISLLVCAALCLFLAVQVDNAPREGALAPLLERVGLTGEWAGIPVYALSFLLFVAAGVSALLGYF